MPFLPGVVGIEDENGERVDAPREDGSFAPIILELGDGVSADSVHNGGTTRVRLNTTAAGGSLEAVLVASPTSLNLASTYTSIDSTSVIPGDRVGLFAQNDDTQNGIYTVGSDIKLTRSADTLRFGATVSVRAGTYSNTLWQCTTDNPIVVDTTPLSFQQIPNRRDKKKLDGYARSAREFGVVADGTTDDTAAMQAALDYFAPISMGGTAIGKLVLPAGRMRITKRLRYQGLNGNGFHLEGHLGGTQAGLGSCLVWDGSAADDDAVKAEFSASTSPQSYSGGAINTSVLTDPRHLTITLIGDPVSDFGAGTYYATVTGKDEYGSVVVTKAQIQIDGLGGGDGSPVNNPPFPLGAGVSVTANASTNVFTTGSAHGFVAGDAVMFWNYQTFTIGTWPLPDPISPAAIYYVLSSGLTTTQFKVSAVRDSILGAGTVLDIASAGVTGMKVAKAANVYRSRHRLSQVTQVDLPAFAISISGSVPKVRLGWDGGTILELPGANNVKISHVDFDCASKAQYGLSFRFDLAHTIGCSGNVIEHCSCIAADGPGAAGLSLGEPNDGTGGLQTDTFLAHDCVFASTVGSYQDESGVRMHAGDNVTTFEFTNCGFLYTRYGVRGYSGPFKFTSPSFANIKWAAMQIAGQVSVIGIDMETNWVGARIFQGVGGALGPLLSIRGGAVRTVAPAVDDYVISSSGPIIVDGVSIWNRRSDTSKPKIQCAALGNAVYGGSVTLTGVLLENATGIADLIFDGSGNDAHLMNGVVLNGVVGQDGLTSAITRIEARPPVDARQPVTLLGDGDYTWHPIWAAHGTPVVLSSLTTDHVYTIGTLFATKGDRFEVIRTEKTPYTATFINGGGGGGTLYVSGGPGHIRFRFDGTNWSLERATRPSGDRTVYVADFGARGDGTTDDAAAIQAAFDANNTVGGGLTIRAPRGRYKCTIAIDVGGAPFLLVGDGWTVTGTNPFGDSYWTTVGSITGTVFVFPNATQGFTVTTSLTNGIEFRDLVVLGPGTGTTEGFRCTSASGTSKLRFDHVLFANWYTGINPGGYQEQNWQSVDVMGCGIGVLIDDSATGGTGSGPTDLHFFDLKIQSCTIAAQISVVTGLWWQGGLIQSNATGIKLYPYSGARGPIDIFVEGVWFENQSVASFHIDTTNYQTIRTFLSRCHFGGSNTGDVGANAIKLEDNATFGIIDLRMDGVVAPSADVAISQYSQGVTVRRCKFASLTNASVLSDPGDTIYKWDYQTPNTSVPTFSIAIVDAAITDYTVDIDAVRAGNAAVWRDMRATYVRTGGGAPSVLGAEIGTASPTDSTAGEAAAYTVAVQKSSNTLVVQLSSGVASPVNWRIRIREEVRVAP